MYFNSFVLAIQAFESNHFEQNTRAKTSLKKKPDSSDFIKREFPDSQIDLAACLEIFVIAQNFPRELLFIDNLICMRAARGLIEEHHFPTDTAT